MAKKIVQMNFKYKVEDDELLKLYNGMANYFVELKGLEWKIWLHDPAKKMSGGIFLFKDEKSVNDFQNSYITPRLMKNPAVSDVDVKVFDILPELTKMTRGPI